MFPSWFVGYILGITPPLKVGIVVENSGLIRFVVNLEKMNNKLIWLFCYLFVTLSTNFIVVSLPVFFLCLFYIIWV